MFTHKAGAVLAERRLDIRGLSKSVDETHLAVKQRAGFHEVVYHLFPANLPVSVRGSRQRQNGSVYNPVQPVNSMDVPTVNKSANAHWFLSSSPNLLR